MHSEQTGICDSGSHPGIVTEPDGLWQSRQQRRSHGQPPRHEQQRPGPGQSYDYLENGHYSAACAGKIRDQAGRAERDFTQDVQDMLDDTKKAAKD